MATRTGRAVTATEPAGVGIARVSFPAMPHRRALIDSLRRVESDLASLLAAGERATFHGPPAAAVADLERAVGVAQTEGRRAEVAAATWLLGVALSAAGRYGSGLRVLEPLIRAGEDADVDELAAELRLFASLAASTSASVHRGLGRHEAAAELDRRGLALADGRGEAAFDARLGLASDAVGTGDVDAARARLAESVEILDEHGGDWWRQRVRLDWTTAEIALLAERPDEAVLASAGAVRGAETARAPRHVAKGLLFQGVAELEAGSEDALATLRRAAVLAEGLGALPLVWQARALIGALLGGGESPEGAQSLAAARSAVLTIAGDLTPELREQWLARPNVSALLEG
jgi:tetratricopeptide (TPR) repeat protein